MPGSFPALPRSELFPRLAEGHAAGITVVTPNRRLAGALKAEFDVFQVAKGLASWEDADILPWTSFLERAYEDAFYREGGDRLPQLLGAAQAQVLWESVLEGSGLVSVPQAAAACVEAWRLAHDWDLIPRLGHFPGSEDTVAYAGWARAYARRCKQDDLIDAARLPELGERLLASKPQLLILYGFDVLPPRTVAFLQASGIPVQACGPQPKAGATVATPFPNRAQEFDAIARWARAKLKAAGDRPLRLGVVVPDLQQHRNEVSRRFTRVMHPAAIRPGEPAAPLPFDVSLGLPLSGYPVVDAALGLLAFAQREVDFEAASGLLRSPFLAGAETELAERALLDAKLRRKLSGRVTLRGFVARLTGGARAAFERLLEAQEKAPPRPQALHAWAEHFTALLQAAGYPGERTLDSTEFQARSRFHDLLGELARLGRVLGEVNAERALSELRRLCGDTLFQPETPDVPIQVMGVYEAAGQTFDALWVCGLTETAWPLPARPNPFLPVRLQREAGIPQSSPEEALAFARRVTDGWRTAADEVVFSWPEVEEDRELLPSPLIAGVRRGKVEVPVLDSWRDRIHAARVVETVTEGRAPALKEKTLSGGTKVLADQAACPFRAFATHRLGARPLEAPSDGPDALTRGTLLHKLMEGIWREVRDRAGLERDLGPVIARSAKAAVEHAKLEGRFAALEEQRLARLAREWLGVEKERKDFEVVAIEEERTLEIEGLSLKGRIDRLDRLPDGTHVLVDYKTSKNLTPKMWESDRPDEPQLPLYAVTAKEDVRGVAFAALRAGNMRFYGYTEAKGALPQAVQYHDWDNLRAQWRDTLGTLARDFANGEADVDPKRGDATCRYCELKTLCRVNEKINLLEEPDEGA